MDGICGELKLSPKIKRETTEYHWCTKNFTVQTDYKLNLIKELYECSRIARIFEMKDYPAPNTDCILAVYNALAIKALQKSAQNKD